MPLRTCLIVDDEQSIREYVKAILNRNSSRPSKPQMVLVTFVCSVRESFPVLPIILISGYTDQDLQQRSNISFEFIQKPFRPAILLTASDNATKNMKLRTRRQL